MNFSVNKLFFEINQNFQTFYFSWSVAVLIKIEKMNFIIHKTQVCGKNEGFQILFSSKYICDENLSRICIQFKISVLLSDVILVALWWKSVVIQILMVMILNCLVITNTNWPKLSNLCTMSNGLQWETLVIKIIKLLLDGYKDGLTLTMIFSYGMVSTRLFLSPVGDTNGQQWPMGNSETNGQHLWAKLMPKLG